ncbi:hypothetical protein MMC19_004727 [Ptychographa xylographoides]|nr:hypothetical protein [Ptychographa xylographoides]
MADYLKGLFGSSKTVVPSSSGDDAADFADFAGAPDPVPASSFASPVTASPAGTAPFPTSSTGIVYTKWYRVWERSSPSDFYSEMMILPFILIIAGVHVWGRRKNKRKARSWVQAHAPMLEKEFAVVGFGGRKSPSLEDVQESGLANALADNKLVIPSDLLKEKTAQEYTTYATGRQNVAFVDFKIILFKRFNPFTLLLEYLMSMFFESIKAPEERMEATSYAFDGKEKDLIPVPNQKEQEALEARVRSLQSSYDGFVWAIVNKDNMKKLREDRYDISLTITKDHPKLPTWASVMSESAEVTDFMLTPELIKAVEEAGDTMFEYLIVTDQPVDKPLKLNETIPRKRLILSLQLPPSTSATAYTPTASIFTYFLRLPDTLVSQAHFRPEVNRKIKATREEESRKLRRVDEDEKAEERKLEGDKKKKEEREKKLKSLSPAEQSKFLEKERERDRKKSEKRMSRKG